MQESDVTQSEPELMGHPSGLFYIVFTEAWERFSFYGMQALLVLYMATYLLQAGTIEAVVGFSTLRSVIESIFGQLSSQALTSQIFGIYIGLVYLMPVFGGYLGDRVIGRTRAVLIGAFLMALGHFLMASEAAFLFALMFLVAGSGLLKGNLAAQVGGLYKSEDSRRNSAFAIYNVAINIGATIAPLICGTLGELYGWHYGFGAAGLGMLVGIVIYIRGRRFLPADRLATAANSGKSKLLPGDRFKILAISVLVLISTLFWTAQTQVWNTYPLWVRARVDREVLGQLMPITWFQSIDAGAVLLFAPIILWFWRRKAIRSEAVSDQVRKIAFGFLVYAIAFSWLATGESVAAPGQVAIFWPVVFHLILAIGFLYVGPIVMSLISRSAPASVSAMMMSSYYLSIFLGSILSGWMGRFYEVYAPATFWFIHASLVGSGCLILLVTRKVFFEAALQPRP